MSNSISVNESLAELIRISTTLGSGAAIVQGSGGNTSVKTDDGKYMYIKASGTALKDMSAKRGWRRVRVDKVLSIVKNASLARLGANKRELAVADRLLAACDDNIKSNAAPSVESCFHAIMDRYVIHLHPQAVGAYLSARDGKSILRYRFASEEFPPLWVPYEDIGISLARKIAELVAGYEKKFKKKPTVIFLAKHGLLVSGSRFASTLGTVRRVIKNCNAGLRPVKMMPVKAVPAKAVDEVKKAIRQAYLEATGERATVSCFNDAVISEFAARSDAAKLLSYPALTPQELIYANGPAKWLDTVDSAKIADMLGQQIAAGEKPALAFLDKRLGLFAVGGKHQAEVVRDISRASLYARMHACEMGGVSPLNKSQRDTINNSG